MASFLAQLPPPEEIQRKAEEVTSRPEYQLDTAASRAALNWLLRVLEWILTPFRWLFEALDGLPYFLRWVVVILLAVICALLIAHIVWSFVTAIRDPQRRSRRGRDLLSDEPIDPAQLVREAEEARARGDYIEAVRLLFRASLVRLERSENRKFRPGFTNRALLARYRSSPLGEPLARLVETIDAKWYGDEVCRDEDYVACRAEHDRIGRLIRERDHAVGA